MNLKPSSNHKIYIQALRQMTPEKRLLKTFEKEAQRPMCNHAIYGLINGIQVLRRNKKGGMCTALVARGERHMNQSIAEMWGEGLN